MFMTVFLEFLSGERYFSKPSVQLLCSTTIALCLANTPHFSFSPMWNGRNTKLIFVPSWGHDQLVPLPMPAWNSGA